MTKKLLTLEEYANRPNPIYYCGCVKKGPWCKVFDEKTGKYEERAKKSLPFFRDEELVQVLIRYRLIREY